MLWNANHRIGTIFTTTTAASWPPAERRTTSPASPLRPVRFHPHPFWPKLGAKKGSQANEKKAKKMAHLSHTMLAGASPGAVCPTDMLGYSRFGNEVKKRDFRSLQKYDQTTSGEMRCWMQHKNGDQFSVSMTLQDSVGDLNLTKMSKQVSDAYTNAKVRS